MTLDKNVSETERRASAARDWWRRLQPMETKDRVLPGDRATLARLRRASSLMEAATEPATAELYMKLGFRNESRDLARTALIAAVLAHVRKDDGPPVAKAIGGSDDMALVSPLRLKRLIAAREPDELLIAFRRVVAMLDRTANVRDLARQLIAWTSDSEYSRQADIARTHFAFAYHGAADFSPQAEPAEPDASASASTNATSTAIKKD